MYICRQEAGNRGRRRRGNRSRRGNRDRKTLDNNTNNTNTNNTNSTNNTNNIAGRPPRATAKSSSSAINNKSVPRGVGALGTSGHGQTFIMPTE